MQLYKMGRIKKILVSGGSGRLVETGEREADELAALLRLMGVPRKDILVENSPEDNLAGRDRQIETAVQELLKELGSKGAVAGKKD